MQKILLDFTIQTDWRIKLPHNVTGYHQCGQEDKSVLANQHCCTWRWWPRQERIWKDKQLCWRQIGRRKDIKNTTALIPVVIYGTHKRTGWLINITPKSPYFLDELGSKTVYNWVILGISQQGFCPILQHCDVTVKNSLFLFASFRFSTSSKGLSNGIPSQELSSFLFTQYWRRQWQQLKSAVSLHWHSP